MRPVLFACLTLLLFACSPPGMQAQEGPFAEFPELKLDRDWPWWRGPYRDGKSSLATEYPTQFSDQQNVQWKTRVPGRGHGSPIVLANRIYLLTAEDKPENHSVLCYDLATGESLWQTQINRGGFPSQNHPKNTEASPTLATDGELLFAVIFHHQQVEMVALRTDGGLAWRQTVGPFNPQRYEYGYAPSPLLHGSSIIVSTEQDGESSLSAWDRQTGKPLWKTPRPSNISFSSPVVAQVAGQTQLLISGGDRVNAFNPDNGQLLWSVEGTTAATCGTMVWNDRLVFASGGYPDSETIAIVADGSGKIAWRNSQKCYEQSMIVVGDHVYALTDKGVMYCWRAVDGVEQWRERLAGPVSASPIFAGGHIYWSNETGSHYVFKPDPAGFQLVSENRLGNDNFASPAAVGGKLLLRIGQKNGTAREEYLYCIGQ